MSKITDFLKKRVVLPLIRNYTALWNGKSFFSLVDDKKTYKGSERIPLIIVGRAQYSEVVGSFPIKDTKELKLLLEQKYGSWASHWIGKWEGGERKVRTVKYSESLEAVMQNKPLIVIPESWLVSRAMANDTFARIDSFGVAWYIRKLAGSFDSLVENNLTRNSDIAKASLGVPEEHKCSQVDNQTLKSYLKTGLLKLPLNIWPALRLKSSLRKELPIRDMVIAGTAAIACYFLLSTAYLSISNYWAESTVSDQTSKVEKKLELRQKATQDVSRIEALNSMIAGSESLINVWDIIGVIYKQDVRINNLQTTMSQIELSGVAKSATSLASQLRSLKLVKSVELTSPVRKGRDGDVFNLLITIKEEEIK